MPSRKILAVARHEFVGTVTRLGYLLTLFGMPVFVGAIGGLSGFAALQSELSARTRSVQIGFVDESGLFARAPGVVTAEEPKRSPLPRGQRDLASLIVAGSARLVRFASLEEARPALVRGEIAGIVRVPRDYLASGKLIEYVPPPRGLRPSSVAPILRRWMARALLEGRVEPLVAARAVQPPEIETFFLRADGRVEPEDMARALAPFLVPLGFALLLMLSIFTSASYLATGLAEEKQNRALEMLLTSVTPEQLFWGKLIGIGGAALLQFLIYLAAVAAPAAVLFVGLGIRFGQAFVGLAYFVVGFFFFGSVLLAIGSLGNTQKYTQQLAGLFTFTAVVPLMMTPALLERPAGTLARAMTYIPFTAPITAMLRSGAGGLPWWEAVLSLAALFLAAVLAMKGSARIFRVALLATGTTPSLGQIWSWLRG